MEKSSFFEIKGLFIFEGPIQRCISPGVEVKHDDYEKRFFFDVNKTKILRIEFQIYPFELARQATHKILTITGDEDNVLFEIHHHHTDKLTLVSGGKEHLVSKGKLYLDDWNLVSIIANFEKNSVVIHLNGESAVTNKYTKNLTEGLHTLTFGHKEHALTFKGLMKDFRVDSESDISNQYKDIPKHKPIFAEPQNLQIGPAKQLHLWKPDEAADRFQIVRTPLQKTYAKKKGKPQILICHDFANGYVLDNNVFGFDTLSLTYRFLHWNQLDIYIHFTHCFLGLPAPQVTNLAHLYGTKSLGVFCTEWDEGAKVNKLILSGMAEDEDGELRFKGKYYYADKLIAVCKHYGFDGYLLNIEARVDNAYELCDWVSYLTKKIHEEIPGSLIIWYDSVITSGEVRWQSMVNEANKIFFDAADYFFTDYHWGEQKLIMSAQNAGNEIHKLFTGIDCCGRGAYMGGQFNSYMGVKKITELKSSVALFAQGWSGMGNYGSSSWDLFHRNDERLWMGREYSILASHEGTINNPKIDWKEDLSQGSGWAYSKTDGLKETVSTASFDFCMRSITVDLPNLKIDFGGDQPGILVFDFQVRGTGPKVEDPWICVMECIDGNGKVILSKDSFFQNVQFEKNNSIDPRLNPNAQSYMNKATADWVQHKIEINLKEVNQNIRKNIKFVRVSEAGKDLEYWAGHFGPQFKSEIVSIKKGYDPSKSILKMMGPRRNISLPIHTYFNEGHGEAMYIEGIKQNRPGKFYNSVGDIDINFGYYSSEKRYKFFDSEDKLLGSFHMFNNEPWNGGTSMRLLGDINGSSVQTYKLYKTEFEVSSLTVLLCVTNLHPDLTITPFIIDKKKNLQKFKQEKGVKKNGWIYYRYDLTFDNPTIVRGIYFYLENVSQKMVSYSINFGELSIYEGKTWNEQIKDLELKKTNEFVKNFDARMAPNNLVYKDRFSSKKCYSAQFEFEISQSKHLLVKYYQIFRNDIWIVNSRMPVVHVENVPIEKDRTYDEFKVQLVLLNGRKEKLANIEPYILMYDDISNF